MQNLMKFDKETEFGGRYTIVPPEERYSDMHATGMFFCFEALFGLIGTIPAFIWLLVHFIFG